MIEVIFYTIPASSSPWDSSIGNTVARVHYANNTTNGAYYTWCAATAGSCSSATTNNAIASSSVCPSGWRLPTHDEQVTLNGLGSKWETVDGVNGRTFGGGFFPAAGLVYNGSLRFVGSDGLYWFSTAGDSDNAYNLHFDGSSVGTSLNDRYNGFSVRCIAL